MSELTEPLRLARGSHKAGSGKGCAMNVISWENGDTEITDFPSCSARPLARVVQAVNDSICNHSQVPGLLCPPCSLTVLELGHATVGTAGASREQEAAWVAEMLDSPDWGCARYASAPAVITAVADLYRRRSRGDEPGRALWLSAAYSAADAVYSAADAAEYAAYNAAYYNAAYNAVYSAAEYTAYTAARAAANAAASAAYSAANAAYARLAIAAWRRICGMSLEPARRPLVTSAAVSAMLTAGISGEEVK